MQTDNLSFLSFRLFSGRQHPFFSSNTTCNYVYAIYKEKKEKIVCFQVLVVKYYKYIYDMYFVKWHYRQLYQFILCYIISYHIKSYHIISYRIVLYCIVLYCILMLSCLILSYTDYIMYKLCYVVILCYVMWCCVMLCYVVFINITLLLVLFYFLFMFYLETSILQVSILYYHYTVVITIIYSVARTNISVQFRQPYSIPIQILGVHRK